MYTNKKRRVRMNNYLFLGVIFLILLFSKVSINLINIREIEINIKLKLLK